MLKDYELIWVKGKLCRPNFFGENWKIGVWARMCFFGTANWAETTYKHICLRTSLTDSSFAQLSEIVVTQLLNRALSDPNCIRYIFSRICIYIYVWNCIRLCVCLGLGIGVEWYRYRCWFQETARPDSVWKASKGKEQEATKQHTWKWRASPRPQNAHSLRPSVLAPKLGNGLRPPRVFLWHQKCCRCEGSRNFGPENTKGPFWESM